MKIKALRNLILFDGKQLFKDKEYDCFKDCICLDLIRAGHVVEVKEEVKENIFNNEEVIEEVKKPRRTRKSKVGDV